MAAISPTVSSPSAFARARAWLRARNVPPVYGILIIIFLVSILLDLYPPLADDISLDDVGSNAGPG